MPARTPLLCSILALTASAVGCGSDVGSERAATAGGASIPHVNLFACGAKLACEQMIIHLAPEPREGLTCAAKLFASGSPGALSVLDTPGPYLNETEQLILALGDGTAVVQSRHRECMDDCPNPFWEWPSAHRLCTLTLGDGVAAACSADGTRGGGGASGGEMDCSWSAWGPGGLDDCTEIPDRTCADVSSSLE